MEHLSQYLAAPHVWAFPRVLPLASPAHHPQDGAWKPPKEAAPLSLHPFSGACSSFDFAQPFFA